MSIQSATFFTKRTNDHVPSMSYAADVRHGGIGTIVVPALDAVDTDVVLDGYSVAAAGTVTSFNTLLLQTEAQMGRYGRNVTAVASGANADALTINGRDYLGQFMTETLTLNGTTAVPGKKAFRWIDSIVHLDQAVTIDVGLGIVLGLPYKVIKMFTELVDGAVPADAGAVVAGLASTTTPTATTADCRGTYAPHANNTPDGSKVYTLTCQFDRENLHGTAQYAA